MKPKKNNPTSKPKKKPQTRNIVLSDGTVIKANDNNKGNLASGKVGKNVYNKPVPDEEETLEPEDGFEAAKYPPPKKNQVFRKTWMGFIDNVTSRVNFKPSHLLTLEILCDLYVELESLNQFLRTNGMSFKVITIAGETRRMYPEVAQRDKVRSQIYSYSKQLDLFPKKDSSPKSGDEGDTEKWT